MLNLNTSEFLVTKVGLKFMLKCFAESECLLGHDVLLKGKQAHKGWRERVQISENLNKMKLEKTNNFI